RRGDLAMARAGLFMRRLRCGSGCVGEVAWRAAGKATAAKLSDCSGRDEQAGVPRRPAAEQEERPVLPKEGWQATQNRGVRSGLLLQLRNWGIWLRGVVGFLQHTSR